MSINFFYAAVFRPLCYYIIFLLVLQFKKTSKSVFLSIYYIVPLYISYFHAFLLCFLLVYFNNYILFYLTFSKNTPNLTTF